MIYPFSVMPVANPWTVALRASLWKLAHLSIPHRNITSCGYAFSARAPSAAILRCGLRWPGNEVSCVMRGPHLEAVKAERPDAARRRCRIQGQREAPPTIRPTLGPQDFVISTLKATGVTALATGLKPLLRDDTGVVFAQNGIPWWYDIGLPEDHPPPPDLGFLDPGRQPCARRSRRERIIGGVVFSSNEVIAPGVVANLSPERNMLLVGECDDREGERIARLRSVLEAAQIASAAVSQIRESIWSKLLTNMSMSVLCLLTGQTARGVRDEPALADVIPRMLDEANAIAQSCYPDVKRVTRSGPAPNHKPSILQDFELGRAMEIDTLVRAPAAFARAAGLSTPMLDLMAALAIRKARDKGLYPP